MSQSSPRPIQGPRVRQAFVLEAAAGDCTQLGQRDLSSLFLVSDTFFLDTQVIDQAKVDLERDIYKSKYSNGTLLER